MDTQEFIDVIVSEVHDSSIKVVKENLKQPPGRRPPRERVEVSDWYNSLSEADRGMVEEVIKHSVHAAIFGFLCTIDGVRVISSGEFNFQSNEGETISRINDPKEPYLHDIYQVKVWDEIMGESP